MKTTSKVFLIISLVLSSICILLGLFLIVGGLTTSDYYYYDPTPYVVSGISILLVCAVKLTVSIIALMKLVSATTHSQLVGIGVCTIIFCSPLCGIFMLLIKDEDLKPKMAYASNEQITPNNLNTSASNNANISKTVQPPKQGLKIIHCSKCGEKVEEGQAFCGKCGASLFNKCPKCSTINKSNDLFCTHCGCRLKEQ